MTPNVTAADFPDWPHLAKAAQHRNPDGSTRPALGTLAQELAFARDGFPPAPLPDALTRRLVATVLADPGAFGRVFAHCIQAAQKGTENGD